jgi:glyoxylate/hydroxypyruvate reductase A
MLHIIHPSAAPDWAAALRAALPDMPITTQADTIDPAAVDFLVCWKPADGALAPFTRLRAVFAMGAGIDHLLQRADLPENVPVIRLTDAGMAPQMLEYVLYGLLHFQRDFDHYARQQATGQWQAHPPKAAAETRVTVLGLGAIGQHVARGLGTLGYTVTGWRRTAKALEGINTRHGLEALPALLGHTDVLVSILPNTPDTAGLLDAGQLGRLPAGAVVINAGRGEVLDLPALCSALDSGHLRGALLDVLPHEPLAPDNPLWQQQGLLITPHIAAATLISESARQIAGKLRDWQAGRPVAGLVDRARAY